MKFTKDNCVCIAPQKVGVEVTKDVLESQNLLLGQAYNRLPAQMRLINV